MQAITEKNKQIKLNILKVQLLDFYDIFNIFTDEKIQRMPKINPDINYWVFADAGRATVCKTELSKMNKVDKSLPGYICPTLLIDNLDVYRLKMGDAFQLSGHTWVVVSEETALCDEIIGKETGEQNYGKGPTIEYYEISNIKQQIEQWAKENNIEIGKRRRYHARGSMRGYSERDLIRQMAQCPKRSILEPTCPLHLM